MRRSIAIVPLVFSLAAPGVPAGPARADTPRTGAAAGEHVYDLKWSVEAKDIPAGAAKATLWIALPQSRPEQSVSNLAVDTRFGFEFGEDPDFGNRVLVVTAENPPPSFRVDLAARVRRLPVDRPEPEVLRDRERRLYLRHEALVSLGPRIRAIADSLGGDSRTRYDYVLDQMEYDKTAPGWGRGDSERACDVHKGNCTDFHSLFMSLSRAEGVPAVFEMGYPMKPEGETDQVGGYHCWAWFYDGDAWVPVDISEADKAPEKTEFFFGHLDADRITFSRGRDIRLPGMKGAPLNYLPSGGYLEVDGRPAGEVVRSITYRVE